MVAHMIRFYTLRLLKDKVGHLILIGLPLVLITIMVALNEENIPAGEFDDMVLYIGLTYIVMFQGFGAAYTFEGLEHDFYKPFRSRLLVSPVNPIKFVFSQIGLSIIVSFIQSLLLVGYLVVMYGINIPNLAGVILALLLGVILSQLLASIIIFLVKKANLAQAIITVYIIIAMLVGGFFVSFSESSLTSFLEQFSSPLAWTHFTAYAFMEASVGDIMLGTGLLVSTILILFALTYKLSQRVKR